jgi:putative peptidoglycan lipid II flippase
MANLAPGIPGLPETAQPAGGSRRLAHAAGLVSFGTLLSRILGLVRDQLFAVLFGATKFADAFNIAFRIPNLLRDLFAEGALSAAFVPTFTDHLHNRSRSDAFQLANRLITTLAVVLALLVLIGVLFSDALVAALAPGFGAVAGKRELTVLLTRIMLPFLPLVSLAAVAMGMLNSLNRFFIPAFAPACFNIVAVVAGVGLWIAGLDPAVAVAGWAVGTLLGGLAQFLVQTPALRREGWRFRPHLDLRFRDPGMRRMVVLMGPATVGLAATQVNIVVNSMFASQQPAAVSWLNYAFRLMQLPLGLFGVAVGTIATAALARRAAARDIPGMRQTLAQSLRLVAFLTIPATFGLIALAQPIIGLIYQHGRFGASDTEATARALLFYAIGLFAYSSVKVVAPAFYAVGRPRAPLLASCLAVGANLAFNFALFPVLGYRGLALGTSLAALINFTVLAVVFHRSYGGLRDRTLWVGVLKIVAAAAPMAIVAWVAARACAHAVGDHSLTARAVIALLPVGLGIGIYAGLCHLLRVAELGDLLSLLHRRTRPEI